MRTKLQGRRSLFIWLQYIVILVAMVGFGYAVQSWRLLPTRGGAESTPSAPPTIVSLATPTAAQEPIIATVAPSEPPPTDTPDWVATAVVETVTASGAATDTPTPVPVPATATATSAPLPTTPPTPEPPVTVADADLAQLREEVLAAMRRSRIRNDYPQQGTQFVDALLAHLTEFQLPTLGVTQATVEQALRRPDVGDRINALVQEVWADWRGIAKRKGFDLNTREPTYNEHNISPFRQLVVRLIQGRQGALRDYQQHGLHNFLARSEEAAVWSNNIDGVIGAVNRESFQWP